MTLQEEYIAFMSQLGEAMTSWAVVEFDVMQMLSVCFKGDDENLEAVCIGLVSLEGFRAKLGFVHAVATTKLPAEHVENWIDLADRARTQSSSRNKIVHLPVGMYESARAGRRVVLNSLVSAEQGVNKPRRGAPKPLPPALGINDLIKITEEFAALSCALQNFAARVTGQPEPHSKSAERASHHMTATDRLRQIHAELGHTQQSSREKRRLQDAENAAASLRDLLSKD